MFLPSESDRAMALGRAVSPLPSAGLDESAAQWPAIPNRELKQNRPALPGSPIHHLASRPRLRTFSLNSFPLGDYARAL